MIEGIFAHRPSLIVVDVFVISEWITNKTAILCIDLMFEGKCSKYCATGTTIVSRALTPA